jgi:hypothetical protein
LSKKTQMLFWPERSGSNQIRIHNTDLNTCHSFKGIVSKEFEIHFLYYLKAWQCLHLPFQIFEYTTFCGEFYYFPNVLTNTAKQRSSVILLGLNKNPPGNVKLWNFYINKS